MQTFLPFPNFKKSAEALDKKRCWKQVIEAKQIISVLTNPNPLSKAWHSHPAVKMWEGHADTLKMYFNVMLETAIQHHGINTVYLPYTDIDNFKATHRPPWWFGNKNFHRAMRAALIKKDKAFYLPLFPYDEFFNEGKYFWPTKEIKNKKVITYFRII